MMAREKINAINHDLVSLSESVYEYLSWYDTGEAGRNLPKHEMPNPVSRIVEKKEREYHRFRQEFMKALDSQERRLEQLRVLRLAYLSLPEEEYMVLRTLYEEAVPWKAAAGKLGISKRTLAAVRRRAIDDIRDFMRKMEQPSDMPGVAEPGVNYGNQR